VISLLLRVTCVIRERTISTDVWQAMVACATESQKNSIEPLFLNSWLTIPHCWIYSYRSHSNLDPRHLHSSFLLSHFSIAISSLYHGALFQKEITLDLIGAIWLRVSSRTCWYLDTAEAKHRLSSNRPPRLTASMKVSTSRFLSGRETTVLHMLGGLSSVRLNVIACGFFGVT